MRTNYTTTDSWLDHGVLVVNAEETNELGTRTILLPMHTVIEHAVRRHRDRLFQSTFRRSHG